MKKCYNCGAGVPDNAKFCAKCGKPLEITQDLIDRAKAGDSAAQTELYQRTYKIVYAKTRAKISDEDAVMDIMQETYLRAFTNLDQLKKAETFPSWLLTIASRQACDWYRKNGKENENIQLSQLENENDDSLSEDDDLFDKPEDRSDLIPDEALDRAETGRLLSEILDTLPEDQRMILTMFYYDDMSLNEISEELGVSLSTVKSRLTAGKKKVKAKVLELEKAGTKLYSLGPVAFLVYLLRHAELFTPEIPSNTILGLTGTGAAAGGVSAGASAGSATVRGASAGAGSVAAGGASAGTSTGGAASKIAGGTAAKASAAAAAKGVSVRAAVAIVAAAVVVAGGGITTAVVVTNDNEQTEPETVVVDTLNVEVEPPTEEIILAMIDPLAFWSVNDMYSDAVGTGPIVPTVNEAAELAATSYYFSNNTEYETFEYDDGTSGGGYLLPEDELAEYLKNMFGPEYLLSEFTNTLLESTEGRPEYISSFPEIGISEGWAQMTLFEENDQFYYQFPAGDAYVHPGDTSVTNIEKIDNDENSYNVTVQYTYSTERTIGANDDGSGIFETVLRGRDVEYEMMPCEDSDYGWIISKITYKEFYDLGSEQQEEDQEQEENQAVDDEQAAEVEQEKEIGNVIKSMTVRDENGKISEYCTYDAHGNLETDTQYYGYFNDISTTYEYKNTYDDNGNLQTCTEYDNDGEIYSITDYTYNNNGILQTETRGLSDEDETYIRIDYTYDDNGNLQEENHVSNGAAPWRFEYTYDNNGNIQTMIRYEADGSERYDYTCDDEGNVQTCTQLNNDGSIRSRTEYTYDENGNVLTETEYDSDELVTSSLSYEYEYYD